MNFKKILFPTDFSHCGDAALQMASVLAKESGAELIILHIEEPPAAYAGGEMYYGMLDPSVEQLQKLLHDIKPLDESVRCRYELLEGDPSQAIARFAVDEKVDLIVMGTHGRTGLLHLMIGSTAEAVVRRAPCPVLTYKEPQKAEAVT